MAWPELSARSLEMRVYHDNSDDDSRRDECMGQITLALHQLDLTARTVLCKGISADDKQVNFVTTVGLTDDERCLIHSQSACGEII